MGKAKSEAEELLEVFNGKHGELIRQIVEAINGMVRDHDGDSLLLFRRHLEVMIGLIDETLGGGVIRRSAGEN